MSKFSIIIPVYNVAPYLRESLDSVLNQTFIDWECICVDDGSTDGSGAILDEYAKKDKRFKVIHQKNQGVSVARNAALKIASGEMVGFLDGDDKFTLNLLQRINNALVDDSGLDAVGFGAVYVNENSRERSRFGNTSLLSDKVFKAGNDVLKEGRGGYGNFAWALWDKFFRLSVIHENMIAFKEGMKYSEDSLFTQTFLAYACKIALFPSFIGYEYLLRDGSATHSDVSKILEDPFKLPRELFVIYLQRKVSGLRKQIQLDLAGALMSGKSAGGEIRRHCVEYIVNSKEMDEWVIEFLLLHGTWKCRIFAVIYICACHKSLRKKLLLKM